MLCRLYTGGDGLAHFEDIAPDYIFKTEGPEAGKTGSSFQRLKPAEGVFWETFPPGHSSDLHVTRERRYVVTLRGRMEIGNGSGESRVFGPGDTCLIEDLTGKGHYIKVIGDEQRDSIAIVVPPDPATGPYTYRMQYPEG